MTSQTWWQRFNESWGVENPVLRREWRLLRGHGRSARPLWWLAVSAVAYLVVVDILHWFSDGVPTGEGLIHLRHSMVVQLLFVCLLTPPLVATALCQEREQRTLEFLLLTRLSASEVCWGKMAGRVLPVAFLLLAFVPGTLVALLIGGIGLARLLVAHGILLSTVFTVSALSLVFSAYSRRAWMAIPLAYAAVAAWMSGFAALEATLEEWDWRGPVAGPTFELVHPFEAMWTILTDKEGDREVLPADSPLRHRRRELFALASPLALTAIGAVLCFLVCPMVLRREHRSRR